MTDSYVASEEDNVDDSFESQTTSTKHMLTKVRISNFKRIKEAELEIGPVTYIVGGNNSGKSSAIQAIHTAVTAAQVGRERQQQVIPTSSLRYSPAAEFESIGHGRLLENKADGLRAIVEFRSQTDNPTEDSGGVWVFRTVCFERVVLSSPGCLWPGRMDDHEEVLEAHA